TPVGAKRKGDARRRALINRLRLNEGIGLTQVRGVIYKVDGIGLKVGIASSSWNPQETNRWFLGLPGGEFDHAVLLCELEDNELIALSLNRDFLSDHGALLSRDERGQV